MGSSVREISPGVFMGMKSGSVIETTQKKVEPDAIVTAYSSSDEWARWGTDNKYPLHIIDKTKQDPVSMGAIGFKIEAHYGLGLELCEVEYVKKAKGTEKVFHPVAIEDYPEIDEFFFENDIENFAQGIIQDFEWFNRYHVQYIPNRLKTKILKVSSGLDEIGTANFLRTKDIRKKKRNKETGRMEGFYISHDWSEEVPKKVFIPAFDQRNPFRYPNAIYEHKLVSNSNDYYITPRWYSSLKWLEVAARIPDWIASNIDNSINIKYHITYPEKYFEELYPVEKSGSEQKQREDIEKAKAELFQSLDNMLAGEKNVGKNFITAFVIDHNGNQLPGWSITPITNDIKDEAWLKADQSAAIRTLTGHGVDAGLAGVVLSNSTSGSGSDVREKLNAHNQLKTIIPRQTTTEWFEIVKRVNGWKPQSANAKSLKLTYKNMILQSFNENKSGFEKQNEPSPTTANKE